MLSWLLTAVPYILAAGTILLGLFTLRKEWEEYKNSRLRLAVVVVLIVVGALTFVSLYRDNREKKTAEENINDLKTQLKETDKMLQESKEKLNGIQNELNEAKTDRKTQMGISKGAIHELSVVRHELELERTPVNRAKIEWRVAIPVVTPCLNTYVEDARKRWKTAYGMLDIKPSMLQFSNTCEDQLSRLFGSISLNVVFCKPCSKMMNPLDPDQMVFWGPKGGLQEIRFSGWVPEGYWLFTVSGNALTPPDQTIGFVERTNSIYILFETVIEEKDLRTPTGKRLSMGDISGGMFVFELGLRHALDSPIVTPKIRTVDLELNNWRFGFAESGYHGPEDRVPFQRIISSEGIFPAFRYVGRAPSYANPYIASPYIKEK